jgi:hypothetical protein
MKKFILLALLVCLFLSQSSPVFAQTAQTSFPNVLTNYSEGGIKLIPGILLGTLVLPYGLVSAGGFAHSNPLPILYLYGDASYTLLAASHFEINLLAGYPIDGTKIPFIKKIADKGYSAKLYTSTFGDMLGGLTKGYTTYKWFNVIVPEKIQIIPVAGFKILPFKGARTYTNKTISGGSLVSTTQTTGALGLSIAAGIRLLQSYDVEAKVEQYQKG